MTCSNRLPKTGQANQAGLCTLEARLQQSDMLGHIPKDSP